MRISALAQRVEPFYVLEVAKAAAEQARLAAHTGRPMIFLNIGEPDFTAPPLVQEAAQRAIRDGLSQYTAATGLPELRERISDWYRQRFGIQVNAGRIVVTSGASTALQLTCLALIDPGDEILMPDPSYPCNRQFVSAAGGVPVMIAAGAADRFQLTAEQVRQAWRRGTSGPGKGTRGVLLASPSNPTGTSLSPVELKRVLETVRELDGVAILDEIYLPLSFDEQGGQTALAFSEDVISINSFSKYFSMTGWRLGWMVVPESLAPCVERLAQNLFICPSAIAQRAALACFEADSLAEYERRRAEFQARRDYFVPTLNEMGLQVPVTPDGAFYAWADCRLACQRLGVKDSWDLSFALMQQAHIAITPGRDFGTSDTRNFIRFSTANAMSQLQEAASRLESLLT